MHRDHVPAIPPYFHLLGFSPITPVHGMVRLYGNANIANADPVRVASDPTAIHILTVQGHPEFTAEIVSVMVDARGRSGAMSAEVVQESQARAYRGHEGIGAVGRAIWRVLGVDAPPAPV